MKKGFVKNKKLRIFYIMRENWAKLCKMREIGWKITHLKILKKNVIFSNFLHYKVSGPDKNRAVSSGIIGELNRVKIF